MRDLIVVAIARLSIAVDYVSEIGEQEIVLYSYLDYAAIAQPW